MPMENVFALNVHQAMKETINQTAKMFQNAHQNIQVCVYCIFKWFFRITKANIFNMKVYGPIATYMQQHHGILIFLQWLHQLQHQEPRLHRQQQEDQLRQQQQLQQQEDRLRLRQQPQHRNLDAIATVFRMKLSFSVIMLSVIHPENTNASSMKNTKTIKCSANTWIQINVLPSQSNKLCFF